MNVQYYCYLSVITDLDNLLEFSVHVDAPSAIESILSIMLRICTAIISNTLLVSKVGTLQSVTCSIFTMFRVFVCVIKYLSTGG